MKINPLTITNPFFPFYFEESRMRNQGAKFSVSSLEDSVPWLETSLSWEKSLSSLSSYFPAPC